MEVNRKSIAEVEVQRAKIQDRIQDMQELQQKLLTFWKRAGLPEESLQVISEQLALEHLAWRGEAKREQQLVQAIREDVTAADADAVIGAPAQEAGSPGWNSMLGRGMRGDVASAESNASGGLGFMPSPEASANAMKLARERGLVGVLSGLEQP